MRCLQCGGTTDMPFSDLCSTCYITLPGQDEIHQAAKYNLDVNPDRNEPVGYFGPIEMILESDDGQLTLPPIDVTPWFAQADDAEIKKLLTAGLRNTPESDAIAVYMKWLSNNKRIGLVFDYCEFKNVGWTATIHNDQAYWWIETNRPTLCKSIVKR